MQQMSNKQSYWRVERETKTTTTYDVSASTHQEAVLLVEQLEQLAQEQRIKNANDHNNILDAKDNFSIKQTRTILSWQK